MSQMCQHPSDVIQKRVTEKNDLNFLPRLTTVHYAVYLPQPQRTVHLRYRSIRSKMIDIPLTRN